MTFDPTLAYDVPLNLGVGATGLGLSLDASAQVNLMAQLNLQMEFGLNLKNFLANPSGGVSSSDAFVEVDNASVSGNVSAQDLNFNANVGFLQAGVVDGSATLNATGMVSIQNPDGTKPILLSNIGAAQVAFSTPTSVISNGQTEPANFLHVSLPLQANIGGVSVLPVSSAPPTVSIDSDNLFDGGSPPSRRVISPRSPASAR